MKSRHPSWIIRYVVPGVLLGVLIVLGTMASAAPIDEPLSRLEFKLSLIKMDILNLYQAGAAAADRPPASSARPSADPVPGREDQSGRVSSPQAVELKELAALMRRLEPSRAAAQDPGSGQMPSDEMRLQLARALLQAKLFSRGEQVLKEIAFQTRREMIAAEAWFHLEKLYYRRGDYPQALGSFYKIPAGGDFPFRQEAFYLAGNSQLHLKDYVKAIELLAKVNRGDEFYPFALYSSGLASLNRKEPGPAQVIFNKLIALNPREDLVLGELINRARLSLGFIFIDQKKFEEALKLLGTIPSHSRYRTQAQSGIGSAYVEMDNCATAIVVYKDFIEQAPFHPEALEAYLHIGNCFSKMSAYRKAVESYQNALKVFSERKESISKRIRDVQSARFESGPLPSGSKTTDTGKPPDPFTSEFRLQPGGLKLMDVYEEWVHLDELIHSQIRLAESLDRQKSSLSQGPHKEPIELQMKDLRRQLLELHRTVVLDDLTNQMRQLDDFIVRGNVGIAKNTILMQDYGSIPRQ